jgi:hypothetical protein
MEPLMRGLTLVEFEELVVVSNQISANHQRLILKEVDHAEILLTVCRVREAPTEVTVYS